MRGMEQLAGSGSMTLPGEQVCHVAGITQDDSQGPDALAVQEDSTLAAGTHSSSQQNATRDFRWAARHLTRTEGHV